MTLWRKHPDLARDWVEDAYADIIGAGPDHPFERLDGSKPVFARYTTSLAAVMGMGRPATVATVNVSVGR